MTSVGMAKMTLGKTAFGLCRSCTRKDVSIVLINAHSKWIEAFCTPTATSAAVIEELGPLFTKFGIPETVVTDNGTCFMSAEFENFLASNGIRHITSAPYHPATNGLAEGAVQNVKRGLKKSGEGSVKS